MMIKEVPSRYESAEIAALVYDLKRRQQAFEGKGIKGILDQLAKLFRAVPLWVNEVNLFPGDTVKDIRIVPVSYGKVVFSVIPPSDMPNARFKCTFHYTKFDNNRFDLGRAFLNEGKLKEEVDRGILKSIIPDISQQDLAKYLQNIVRNWTTGPVHAELTFLKYDEKSPLAALNTRRGRFRLQARSKAVSDFKLRELRRRYPDRYI